MVRDKLTSSCRSTLKQKKKTNTARFTFDSDWGYIRIWIWGYSLDGNAAFGQEPGYSYSRKGWGYVKAGVLGQSGSGILRHKPKLYNGTEQKLLMD